MAFATRTIVSDCNTINSYYTPKFNTITPNSFPYTRLALDRQWIHSNSCFVKGLFKENSFKILLMRGQQHESQNSCSSQIKNVLFSSFFELSFLKTPLRYSILPLKNQCRGFLTVSTVTNKMKP
jgi:hypothetical protein